MSEKWYLTFACILVGSFTFSVALTAVIRRLALRWNFLDHPGERKIHRAPVPLLGGVAICATFYVVILACFLAPRFMLELGDDWLARRFLAGLGENASIKLGGLLGGPF